MKFTLEIELGNDAMQTEADVADVLLRLRDKLKDMQGWEPGDGGAIFDVNGNTIAGWTVSA